MVLGKISHNYKNVDSLLSQKVNVIGKVEGVDFKVPSTYWYTYKMSMLMIWF